MPALGRRSQPHLHWSPWPGCRQRPTCRAMARPKASRPAKQRLLRQWQPTGLRLRWQGVRAPWIVHRPRLLASRTMSPRGRLPKLPRRPRSIEIRLRWPDRRSPRHPRPKPAPCCRMLRMSRRWLGQDCPLRWTSIRLHRHLRRRPSSAAPWRMQDVPPRSHARRWPLRASRRQRRRARYPSWPIRACSAVLRSCPPRRFLREPRRRWPSSKGRSPLPLRRTPARRRRSHLHWRSSARRGCCSEARIDSRRHRSPEPGPHRRKARGWQQRRRRR